MAETNPKKNPLEELFSSMRDYLDLRLDEIKITLSENLAKILSRIIYFFIVILVSCMAIAFFASAFSAWMETLLGSKTLGMLITGGLLLLIIVVLYFFRNRLMLNSNIRMFIKIFFDKSKEDQGNGNGQGK